MSVVVPSPHVAATHANALPLGGVAATVCATVDAEAMEDALTMVLVRNATVVVAVAV